MAVMEAGDYGGAELILPAFRIAIDARTRGRLLLDGHHLHGNNIIRGELGNFIRLSIVLYTREDMRKCPA